MKRLCSPQPLNFDTITVGQAFALLKEFFHGFRRCLSCRGHAGDSSDSWEEAGATTAIDYQI